MQVPENYSGTTVTPGGMPMEKEEPITAGTGGAPPAPAERAALPEAANREENPGGEAAPVGAGCEPPREEKPHGLPWHALASRFPFLSSLLPPKKAESASRQTSDLALIVGVLLLLSGEQDDILPILLVLLLA